MQTQQSTPLAPYGSMNHLALVAKVGFSKAPLAISATARTVVRRSTAK